MRRVQSVSFDVWGRLWNVNGLCKNMELILNLRLKYMCEAKWGKEDMEKRIDLYMVFDSSGEKMCVGYVFLCWFMVKMWKMCYLWRCFVVFFFWFGGRVMYMGCDNHACSRRVWWIMNSLWNLGGVLKLDYRRIKVLAIWDWVQAW